MKKPHTVAENLNHPGGIARTRAIHGVKLACIFQIFQVLLDDMIVKCNLGIHITHIINHLTGSADLSGDA